jgi:hypothetical protein
VYDARYTEGEKHQPGQQPAHRMQAPHTPPRGGGLSEDWQHQAPPPSPVSPSSQPFAIPNAYRKFRKTTELQAEAEKSAMSFPTFRKTCEAKNPGFESFTCVNCEKVYGGARASGDKTCDAMFCGTDCRTNYMLNNNY